MFNVFRCLFKVSCNYSQIGAVDSFEIYEPVCYNGDVGDYHNVEILCTYIKDK